MKRLLVVFVVFLMFFCSCQSERDFLAYQEKSPKIECTVNEKFKLVIEKKECTYIYIKKPSELTSVYFELSENGSYAISNELKIPIDSSNLGGIFALGNALCLSEGEIISVTDENNTSIVTFENAYGTYTVIYGKNLLPSHIEIHSDSYDYDIDVTGIELK